MPILPEHKELLSTQSESKTLPEQWIIYIHINKINNKVYIGQTKQELNKRCSNGKGYKKCPLFWKAIQKYGWNNFEHKILEGSIKTLEEANQKEKYWIQYYNSTDPKNGYNIDEGGGTSLAQLQLAWNGSKKWRDQNSEHYQNNIKKMHEARIKQCSISVYCIELNQDFYSAGEAARKIGADQSGITKCCKRKQKTARGYHWCYKEDCKNAHN